MNLTLADFVFYPIFEESSFEKTELVSTVLALNQTADWDATLTNIIKAYTGNFNVVNKAGVPITTLVPQVPTIISGLLMNSTMSPYVTDGWMYAGFSMDEDSPINATHKLTFNEEPKEEVVLEFLQ